MLLYYVQNVNRGEGPPRNTFPGVGVRCLHIFRCAPTLGLVTRFRRKAYNYEHNSKENKSKYLQRADWTIETGVPV